MRHLSTQYAMAFKQSPSSTQDVTSVTYIVLVARITTYSSRLDSRRATEEGEAPTKLRVSVRSPIPGLPVKLQAGS